VWLGIGFKLIQTLGSNRQQTIDDLVPYLDLVAAAIAADIVPMTGENRILAISGYRSSLIRDPVKSSSASN
jgi:single-stranded-DNA-specific exonuclease